MKSSVSALAAGLLFGTGLLIAGMTQPAKVIGFLDIFGKWDPSLAAVMAGAIAVHFPLYRLVRKQPHPLCAPAFRVPETKAITPRLILGAAIFGIGWGLAGYCPGPAIVSAASGALPAVAFTAAMLVGMLIHRLLQSRASATP